MSKIIMVSILVGVIIGVGGFALMFNNVQTTEAQGHADGPLDHECECRCVDWADGGAEIDECIEWFCTGYCGDMDHEY